MYINNNTNFNLNNKTEFKNIFFFFCIFLKWFVDETPSKKSELTNHYKIIDFRARLCVKYDSISEHQTAGTTINNNTQSKSKS